MAVTIAVTRERRDGETRTALTPDTVKKLVGMGAAVVVETGSGLGSSIPDTAYAEAGATVARDLKTALTGADILMKVRGPTAAELKKLQDACATVEHPITG